MAFADDVNGLHDEMLQLAATDALRQAVPVELDRYEQNYLDRFGSYLKAHANLASADVVGPENVHAAEQAEFQALVDAKLNDFHDWRTRARTKITTAIGGAPEQSAAQFEPIATGAGFEILADRENGRLQVKFAEKPEQDVRAGLKAAGFRWSKVHEGWGQPLTDEAVASAKKVLGVQEGFAEKEAARRSTRGARGRS